MKCGTGDETGRDGKGRRLKGQEAGGRGKKKGKKISEEELL